MPLATPKQGEKQDAFVDRCMSNDTMKEEFPDNKQRLAVCFSQWKKKKQKKAKEMPMERSYMPIREVEIRTAEDDGTPKLVGYVARFNKLSDDLGGFREKISPGAFAETIKKDDIRALWNHNSDHVLGRTSSGTLKLEEDNKGLRMELNPPDTQLGRDLMVSIRRGDISQMSFGFKCLDEAWRKREGEDGKEESIRTLKQVELFDVSPVTYPAYPQTEIQVRAKAAISQRLTEINNPDDENGDQEPRLKPLAIKKLRVLELEISTKNDQR